MNPLAAVLLVASIALAQVAGAAAAPLRVCSDPNNLPFSNEQREGFENELAALAADALGRAGVEYTWLPQRRGFARNTLNAGLCDLIVGVPADYDFARPTQPYYRSTYVFVSRADDDPAITSLDDPRLRSVRIGVHAVGDDYSNTPGTAALAARGIVDNLVGYSIYGDYSKPHPPSRLIEAVAAGEVDLAIAWGPLAGYFASRQAVPLRVVPVTPPMDRGTIPFVFEIAMATRKDDDRLHRQIEHFLATHASEIRAVLERYGVPLVAEPVTTAAGARAGG